MGGARGESSPASSGGPAAGRVPSSPDVDPSGRHLLARERRLRRRADFVRVQSAPVARVRGAGFLVLVGVRDDAQSARAGFVASKKVGGAVVRNRCKRLLREAFRHCLSRLPPGLDLVVVAHPGLDARSGSSVTRDLARLVPEIARRARGLAERGSRHQAAAEPGRTEAHGPGPERREGASRPRKSRTR